jgi:hypothetical protein
VFKRQPINDELNPVRHIDLSVVVYGSLLWFHEAQMVIIKIAAFRAVAL